MFKLNPLKNSSVTIFLIVGLIVLIRFPFGCKTSPSVSHETPVRLEIERIYQDLEMPGLTAALVMPDGQYISLAAGQSDTIQHIGMKPSDRLMSGSTGKTFVAALIMKLAEEGRLTLDDPLAQYFGDVDFFANIPNSESITIRMLLSHRTGWVQHVFESPTFLTELFDYLKNDPDKYWSPEELFKCVTYDKALFHADGDYHYSDMNYIALGLIIEKITGKRYYDLLKEQILRPFELVNTVPSDRREIAGLVNGYMRDQDPFAFAHPTSLKDGRLLFNPSVEWTGGGLATNSLDLARWASILWGGTFLNSDSVRLMTRNHQYKDQDQPAGYGFGTQIWMSDLGPVFGHSGYYPGYNTIMGYFPRYGIGAAIQINRDYGNGNLQDHLTALVKAKVTTQLEAQVEKK